MRTLAHLAAAGASALLTALTLGCSSGSTFQCPNAHDCAEVATARARAEAEYQARLDAELFGDLPEVGRCSRDLLSQAIAECGVDLCTEICRLHPCDPEPSGCVSRCEAELPTYGAELVQDIALQTAETPLVCTCDVCTAESFGFCEAVWGCTAG